MLGPGISLRHCRLLGFSGLEVLLRMVESTGVWPQGLLNAYIAFFEAVQSVAKDLGISCVLNLHVDASATMCLVNRRGLGKAKHVDMQNLRHTGQAGSSRRRSARA